VTDRQYRTAPDGQGEYDGKKSATLRGPTLAVDFKQTMIDYIERSFGTGRRAAEKLSKAVWV
jgi:hypothetical protein